MFLVCIVKGFPVLQSHSTTETSDFVSYLRIDKTSSCQISCVGPSQILWPILETCYAIHIVHVLLVLPDTIHGLFDWSWGSNVLYWDLDGITVVAVICFDCIVSHKPRESRTGVCFNGTTVNAGCHFENDTKSFHSAIYIMFFFSATPHHFISCFYTSVSHSNKISITIYTPCQTHIKKLFTLVFVGTLDCFFIEIISFGLLNPADDQWEYVTSIDTFVYSGLIRLRFLAWPWRV